MREGRAGVSEWVRSARTSTTVFGVKVDEEMDGWLDDDADCWKLKLTSVT